MTAITDARTMTRVLLPRRARARLLTVLTCAALAATGGLSSHADARGVAHQPAGVSRSGPPEIYTIYHSTPSDPIGEQEIYARINATPSIDSGFRPKIDAPLNEPLRACPPSRCVDVHVPTPADVHITSNLVRVLLPAGYYKKQNAGRHYPVVYLYNGAASSYNGWTRKTLLTQMTRHMQAIFVSPEGGSETKLGMFSDWKDGTYQWETYHVKVLIPWVDKNFRTIRGDRAAIGVSVSTIGALGYAGRHPNLFKAVLSISGLNETDQLSTDELPPGLASAAGLFPVDMKRIWGDPVTNASTWAGHDPTKLVGRLKAQGVKLFLTMGSGFYTGDSSDPIHSGYLEQLLFQGERSFLYQLTEQHVPFDARVSRGNIHDWPFFDAPMRWGIPKIMRVLRDDAH